MIYRLTPQPGQKLSAPQEEMSHLNLDAAIIAAAKYGANVYEHDPADPNSIGYLRWEYDFQTGDLW